MITYQTFLQLPDEPLCTPVVALLATTFGNQTPDEQVVRRG